MARRGAGTPFLLQLSLLLLLHLGGECGPSCPVPQPHHPQHPAPQPGWPGPRGGQERRQRSRRGQDGAWHVPVACPTLGSSSPGLGGPSKGRDSSLCPAWALRS